MPKQETKKIKSSTNGLIEAVSTKSSGKGKELFYLSGAKPIPSSAVPRKWDLETDVVVVGAGGAGLAASVAAAEKGADVITLEKAGSCGGDALFAVAAVALKSRHAKRSGLQPPPESVIFESAMLHNAWMADPDVVRAMVDRMDDTMDWIEDMGVVYDTQFKWGPGVHTPIDPEHPEEGHYCWHPYNARGFIKAMEKRAHALCVKILKNTPAKALVSDSGRVAGILAITKDGKKLYIKSKAVVLTSGGFGANKDMMKQYSVSRNKDDYAYYIGCKSNTGDGIRMAQGIGAGVEGMDKHLLWDGGVPGVGAGPGAYYSAATQLARQPSLTVNKLGKRFFNEAAMFPFPGPGLLSESQANQIIRQKDQTSFTIHDSVTVDRKFILEKYKPMFCEYPCSWFEVSFQKCIAKKTIIKADTIKELARLIDVDEQIFSETLDSYNGYCDKGEDPEYFKPAKYLAPIRQPPFYAVKQIGGALVSTYGGLKVNSKFQVLDKNWKVIPGLYAAGQTLSYAGELQQAFPSGRIAGENSSKEISKK